MVTDDTLEVESAEGLEIPVVETSVDDGLVGNQLDDVTTVPDIVDSVVGQSDETLAYEDEEYLVEGRAQEVAEVTEDDVIEISSEDSADNETDVSENVEEILLEESTSGTDAEEAESDEEILTEAEQQSEVEENSEVDGESESDSPVLRRSRRGRIPKKVTTHSKLGGDMVTEEVT